MRSLISLNARNLVNQVARRTRQARSIYVAEGVGGLTERIRAYAAARLAPPMPVMPVLLVDVLEANISQPFQPKVPTIHPGLPIILNWVTTPAGPGSGGHTTLYRIIRYLEKNGYRNRLYFYDVYGGDHRYYESVARSYYGFNGELGRVQDGMCDAHGVVATGWPTAYPVFNSRCAGKRFYFIQDFEPSFYPAGSLSSLAESTYRMGFHGITIGKCFASKLVNDFGMVVDSFDYGCDLSQYARILTSERKGIVFYARRESPRRGFELGMMALEYFASRHPNVEIHIYGDQLGKLSFPFVGHGRVPPAALNALYNRCYAGLNLSFTNVSLVAQEMLAAGCIPVVNDTPLIREDLKSAFVRYAAPFPQALASELEAVVTQADFESLSLAASASVSKVTWEMAGAAVDSIIRRGIAQHACQRVHEIAPPIHLAGRHSRSGKSHAITNA